MADKSPIQKGQRSNAIAGQDGSSCPQPGASTDARAPHSPTAESITSSPSRNVSPPQDDAVSYNKQNAAQSGLTTPSKLPTPSANRPPRPVSINEASTRALRNPTSNGSSVEASPKWPISPRLRSPTASRRNSNSSIKQQADAEVSDQENTPRASRMMAPQALDSGMKSPPAQVAGPGPKLPRTFGSIAGTLETVQEGDNAGSPHEAGTLGSSSQLSQGQEFTTASSTTASSAFSNEGSQDTTTESEADVGRSRNTVKKATPKQTTQSQPPPLSATRKAAPGLLRKRPSQEGTAAQSMIVETETVPSIPHSSTTIRDGDKKATDKRDDAGSLRKKPSTDTIRPKKERKKVVQKRPSVVSGASTKADLFEAKVSSAADDDGSDSDETFVYESNPPEPRSRIHRHHSRTPSANSIHSFADRRGLRTGSNLAEGHRGVKAKRSMKFASSSYADPSGEDESGEGTVRSYRSKPPSLNISQQQSHGSHWPRDEYFLGAEHSPYSAVFKGRHGANNSARESPRDTPRQSPPPYSTANTPPKGGTLSPHQSGQGGLSGEREPLLGGSLRAQRTRPPGRSHSSNLRHIEYYQEPRRSWYARRFSGCLVFLIVVLLLAMLAAGLVYATTKPLYDVRLIDVQNVLVSEEELMLDLNCFAINPNLVTVTVSDIDVNIFAKSRHVGTDQYWRHHGAAEPQPNHRLLHGRLPFFHSPKLNPRSISISRGIDHGTDPIDDPEGDPQTMLLGRVSHFDSSLTFDASPVRRYAHNSTGELSLEKPGNKTETGGSERWEKVIQHPFQLIVRGVLKYQLPLSSRYLTASVSKSISVDPDENVPGKGLWYDGY